MPNIKPVSDLPNYNEVLKIEEHEENKAVIKLLSELHRGEKSGQENGWLSINDVENKFHE